MAQLSEQELVRREKLSKLRSLGINPYPADLFAVTHNSKSIKSNYQENEKVVIAGRLMRKKNSRKGCIYRNSGQPGTYSSLFQSGRGLPR